MFFLSKRKASFQGRDGVSFDPSLQEPVLRCSICTGEQVAGFRDRSTGVFTEVLLIRGGDDLRAFCSQYGIQENGLRKIY